MTYPLDSVTLPANHAIGTWYSHYQALDLTVRQLETDVTGLGDDAATSMAQISGVVARFRGFVASTPSSLVAGDWWVLISA